MNSNLAQCLMDEFAKRTGLTDQASPRRYLWTDAFAVCNFLGLERHVSDGRYLELAQRLVDQVHHVLGRHRDDDPRSGWISGLPEAEGEASPTRGGLRIGKPLNEPAPDQPPDARSDWDRDGQYFHYLTKWIHALLRMAEETGEQHYLRWAIELGVTAHQAFTYRAPGGAKRMVWKMNIDLSRPLVPSMGHHDPLDGLVCMLRLQQMSASVTETYLELAIGDMSEMCRGIRWETDDPLGIGGLATDAAQLGHLVFDGGVDRLELLRQLLAAADTSLQSFARSTPLHRPARHRLAFREIGLSLGLHAIARLQPLAHADADASALISRLVQNRPLAEQIDAFWSQAEHRRDASWLEHNDINSVMLATSLEPDGYLGF